MQGGHYNPYHHQQIQQQQHLASLLTAAAATSSPSPAAPSPLSKNSNVLHSKGDDTHRINALDSLRGSLLSLYPISSQVISHSAPFLSHGLFQLLSDRAFSVRRAAAITYACLSALSASIPSGSTGIVDRFISWALPQLKSVGDLNCSSEIALDSLQEFLTTGVAVNVERYLPTILKACQELLEDERTSFNLLHQLLRLLTLISCKFEHCFGPHFVDIVDVLLGWALMPELSASNRCVITDSFLKFQNQWLINLQFSLSLLSKFMDDMEILIQDLSLEFTQQAGRLFALFSCFSTVLQVTISGSKEANLIKEISESVENITPRFSMFILSFLKVFGWSTWMEESWKCLILLAEILQDKFSKFYPIAIDILFQYMNQASSQIPELMKTNMRLLSLHKSEVLPSAVKTLLQFESPLSQLRLHPNHLVVASSVNTYIFLVQHGCDSTMTQIIRSLVEELEMIKSMLVNCDSDMTSHKKYTESELLSLVKFDLNLILCSVSIDSDKCFPNNPGRSERLEILSSFMLEMFNPFEQPIHNNPDLQVNIVRSLHKISESEFFTKHITTAHSCTNNTCGSEFLIKYGNCLIRALDSSSALGVKLEALSWIITFGKMTLHVNKHENLIKSHHGPNKCVSICNILLVHIVNASYSREISLRSRVASVLEVLLKAQLLDVRDISYVSLIVLDKLSDPDTQVKYLYIKLLSVVLPLTIYTCGFFDERDDFFKPRDRTVEGNIYRKDWKQVLATKHFPRRLQSQQLVSILSFLSQKLKAPLSSWVQRLVFSCRGKRDHTPTLYEVVEHKNDNSLQPGDNLDKMFPVSNLAAIWWSLHEASRYCINLRLRTNLGGPTQTFAAIERMLLDIPTVLLQDVGQCEGKHIGLFNFHLLPMRLLLEFVESLKKNVYNAYEGSCILHPASKQSSLFFKANKKVCEEWFSRICEPMMHASLSLHCHDATFHYCALKLQDIRDITASTLKEKSNNNLKSKLAADVLKVLRHASLSLCKRHESESLAGLQKWSITTFSSLFGETDINSWMTGLVYQAQGQFEKAAAYFSHLLQSEEVLTSLGSDGIQFVIARAIECYSSVSDWKSLENWLSELQLLRTTHAGKSYSGALTSSGNELNVVHALACFDEGKFDASWSYLDLTPKNSNELTLDPKSALERSEYMLLRSMLEKDKGSEEKVLEDLNKARSMLDETLSTLPLDGVNEAAACAVQLHCINAFEEGMRFNDTNESVSTVLGSLHQVLNSSLTTVYRDCSLWLKILRTYQHVIPKSHVTHLLSEKVLRLARKQKNFSLANRLLNFDHNEILSPSLQFESILLKYAEEKHEEAMLELWLMVGPVIMSSDTSVVDISNDLKAKACLKLNTWLKNENSSTTVRKVISKIHDDFNVQNEYHINSISDSNLNRVIEDIIGITTKVSCSICPTMGKAWLSYSSWCFNQAKNSLLIGGSILNSDLPRDKLQMTEEEIIKVRVIFAKIFDDEENKTLVDSLVNKTICLMHSAANTPGLEISNNKCPTTALASQLHALFLNVTISDCASYVDELIDIWWSLRKRRVELFGHAAQGYFKYLSISSSIIDEEYSAISHYNVAKSKASSSTLRAMLYILHILVNYGVELKDTLKIGFTTVPLLPWQEITPQLFSRLSSHPVDIVRKQLEEILIMMAKQSPSSIVYPMLVDINANDSEPSAELQKIYDYLAKLYPNLIHDVQLVINGLEAITVLWEEQWLHTLQDLHTDVRKRINMLKEEATRIAENSTLNFTDKNKINAAKYSAIMTPVVVALERRLASTSCEPKTPHESWFQRKYNEQLKFALSAFKSPPTSIAALNDVWRPFDAITSSLVKCQDKAMVNLNEVAPQLALLSTSEVPMPGLEKKNLTSNLCITISSFCEQVTILSTKTKPKKIVFVGSDGQKYTYLLKGREDLRLDARIMQLLQTINDVFNSCTGTISRSLAIRYYSVTPVSGRAGLIQWVDNASSMYSIYKSWQIRKQIAQLAANGVGNTNNELPRVPRPSDMFYGKIIPALKEKGIRKVISRRDWPQEVKRKVLIDLMLDTPKEIIWQEMWCASEGFKSFRLKTKRFSSSVAAMSMVGHILGLGDRHLDNILMDFSSGDVIHIDYNVCFDKGRKLKIPEIVPFRLTQTIETALGLTGVEGTFRANCESVIEILRKNKDILLMLLEVFVWDPLVEWTRGDNHDEAAIGGEEKRGMELAVSLSLFASRFQEIRIPLQEHHDLVLSALPAVEAAIKKFSDAMNQFDVVSTTFYHADRERANLLQLETAAKSNLTETRSISKKSQETFELQANEFAQSKAMVTEKAQEASIWIDQHKRILDALRNGSHLEAKSFMKLNDADINVLSLTFAVTISKVPLTVVPEPTQAQCNDMDREVRHVIIELYDGISIAFKAINEYAFALKSVLPLNYFTTSPINSWAQMLQLSINNLSSDVLSIARVQASDIISKSQGDSDLDSVQQRHHDLLLRIDLCAKHIHKIENEYAEMTMTIGANTETKAKENMLSAFTKYMQSVGYLSKKDKKHDHASLKKTRLSLTLRMAANVLTKDIKDKVLKFSNTVDYANNSVFEFEELIERYTLVTSSVNELHKLIGVDNETRIYEANWVLVFQSCKKLLEQMTERILPEMIKSILSHSSEAMDAFGIISQIRGSVDTAMEQLAEIEAERKSLVELENTYFTKVSSITEQQEVLKEASMKEKDNLSWEEAEEIATQEEDCRAQLDQLNQTWNQRDARVLSLAKVESTICNSLVSSEQYFSSLLKVENEDGLNIISGMNLLSSLAKPFSDLELCDNMLKVDVSNESSPSLADTLTSDSRLLDSHSFFIWKVGILYSILNTCMHEISLVDHNIDVDYNALKKNLEIHLHKFLGQYLKKRIAPAFISQLEMENMNLDLDSDKVKVDASSVRRVQLMFEEYCNAHETTRVARSTISTMKKQISEFHGALYGAILEIAQLEWLHDSSLPHLLQSNMLPQNIIEYDQHYPLVCSLNRAQLLEKIQSSISTMRKSLDYLQTCEKTSMQVEGQLERAMGWACGGTSNFEIPSEFHDHLIKRKQFLQKVREQASSVINICTSVMEFEASRDGLYWMPGEKSSGRPVNDGRSWQQAYLTSLTNLDDAYHSVTRAEQELKLAQSKTEAAVSALCSATNDICIASVKIKSASDDLQGILSALRDSAYEASFALSNFGSLSKNHLALISECGSMLEEVLAISKGLDDIYSLGKEAASVHSVLVDEFSKVNNILLPLESSLSADVSALSVALSKDRESNANIPPVHGQALYKSYNIRVREASHALTSLVPSVIKCVEELHTMLTKLARSSSMHAGNLHKALEGLGESQEEVRSQNLPLSETDISSGLALYGHQDDNFHGSSQVRIEDLDTDDNSYSINDDEWISPPEFTLISSSDSSIISDDESLQGKLQNFKYLKGNNTHDSITNNNGHENVLVAASKSKSDHSGSMQDLLLPYEIQIASGGDSGSEVIENSKEREEKEKEKVLDPKNDLGSSKMITDQGHKFEDNLSTLDPVSRITKGQNPYALSVLRQVELKLDGGDIEHNGLMNITEQVDYLLKQATSIDNLCNMYEGWTPWI